MKKLKTGFVCIMAGSLLLSWFIIANAGEFNWTYKTSDESRMSYFEIFNSAGTVVVPNIDPKERTAIYDIPAGNDIKIYGIRACNELGWCSKTSNLVYVIPVVPNVPVGFKIK